MAKPKLTTEEFVERAKKAHGDKYDYSKVEYVGYNTNICIICPMHGEFWQTPHNHLVQSCPKCAIESRRAIQQKTNNTFIVEAQNIHGDKYDYSKVKYKNNKTKLCIICPKHGEFWQVPSDHLNKKGCPFCKASKLENQIATLLSKYYSMIRQKKFNWLGSQSLDFYLPEYNIAIECQGEQHFKPIDFANKGKEWALENFKHVQELDERKKIYVKNIISSYYILL